MSENKKYDTKSAKEMVLERAGEAYCEIGRVRGADTYFEEELIGNAVIKVLEKDTNNREQFLELMGIAYMLQGISTNLRLCNCGKSEHSANEDAF